MAPLKCKKGFQPPADAVAIAAVQEPYTLDPALSPPFRSHNAAFGRPGFVVLPLYRSFHYASFTSSLEPTPCFSPTASCLSLHLGLWSFYTYQFGFFHKFTTLIIHNSFTLSLQAQNLPLSQIFPTIGPHSFSRTDTTDSGCSPFLAYPVLFGSVR